MKKGLSYNKAITLADEIEEKERRKSAFVKKELKKIKKPVDIIKDIHIKLLKPYSNKLKVWIVSGALVRDLYFIDFTEGGHDFVYSFVPVNEIWLDDDLSERERKFVLLHEIHERNLMAKGWSYDKAHADSSRIEFHCRHHLKDLDKFLKKEFKKAIVC
jgi:hypothetical protein